MTSRPFSAAFGGWCSRCRSRIRPGETIVMSDDDGAIHAHCDTVTDFYTEPAHTSETPCPECHLIHRGECL